MKKLVNNEEMKEYFTSLGLVDPLNPEGNAQILCHGPGPNGEEIKKDILNGGLWIKRADKLEDGKSNSYVASGLLSTNILKNDSNTNEIDFESTFISTGADSTLKDYPNRSMSIVSAIPQWFDDIYLGKIYPDKESIKNGSCVLDGLGIDTLPPQFIVGVYKYDSELNEMRFFPNDKFYALNDQNKQDAREFLDNLINNADKSYIADYMQNKEEQFLKELSQIRNGERELNPILLERFNTIYDKLSPYLKNIIDNYNEIEFIRSIQSVKTNATESIKDENVDDIMASLQELL